MGKLAKIIGSLLICILIISMIVILTVGGDYTSPRFKIYFSNESKFNLNFIFGIVPKEFSSSFQQYILPIDTSGRLINFVDNKSPIYSNYIIYKFNKKEKILKGYPPSIFGKRINEEFEWGKHMSELINLSVFNDYIINSKIDSIEKIKYLFSYLLSIPEDPTSFEIIKSKEDLKNMLDKINVDDIEKWDLASKGLKTISSSEQLNLTSEHFYCWYLTTGFVQFTFTIDHNNNRIIDVQSKVVGYLGNELLSCC
jgi:hypothetical protein